MTSWDNRRYSISTSVTVPNLDGGSNPISGSTIAISGSTPNSVVFGTASGYDADFFAKVLNESSCGQFVSINGTSRTLWPGQSFFIFKQNGIWYNDKAARYRLPTGITRFHVKPSTGNDANDGLSSGTAKASIMSALLSAYHEFDWSAVGQTTFEVKLESGETDTANIHLPMHGIVGAQGGAALTITGDEDSILHTSGPAFEGYWPGTRFQLKNLEIKSDTACGLMLGHGAVCFLDDGVKFGDCATSHIQLFKRARLEVQSSYKITGNAYFHVTATNADHVLNGQSVDIMTDLSGLSCFAVADTRGLIDFRGGSINLNGHSVAGSRWAASLQSMVLSGPTGGQSTVYQPTGGGSNPNIQRSTDTYFPGTSEGAKDSCSYYD